MKKPPARRVSVVEHGPRRLDTKWSTETQTARDPDGKTAGPRRQDRRTQTARHAVEHRNPDGKTAGRRHVFEPARRLVEHGPKLQGTSQLRHHSPRGRGTSAPPPDSPGVRRCVQPTRVGEHRPPPIIPREGGEHGPRASEQTWNAACWRQGSTVCVPRGSDAGNIIPAPLMCPAPLNRRGTRRQGSIECNCADAVV